MPEQQPETVESLRQEIALVRELNSAILGSFKQLATAVLAVRVNDLWDRVNDQGARIGDLEVAAKRTDEVLSLQTGRIDKASTYTAKLAHKVEGLSATVYGGKDEAKPA